MNVKLCNGCLKELKDYNPYIVDISIVKVKTIKECDNYCDSKGVLNVDKGGV
jgi:hypothetical protein